MERAKAQDIQITGAPEGGATAPIARAEAEATQNMRAQRREGATATIAKAEAEATQNTWAQRGAIWRQ